MSLLPLVFRVGLPFIPRTHLSRTSAPDSEVQLSFTVSPRSSSNLSPATLDFVRD